MDKKILVKQLKSIFEGLEKEGIRINWLDLAPSRLGIGNYHLAISAKWKKNMHIGDKVDAVSSKLFAMPFEKREPIDFVLVYDSPEALEEDMLDRWEHRTENLYPLVANGKMAEAA